MESPRGPALKIVKALRATNPNATLLEHLQAFESAFATAESGDLYFAFWLMQQQPGEKVSG